MREYKYRAWDEDAEIMIYSDQEYDDYWFGFEGGKLKAWGMIEEVFESDPMEPPHPESYEIDNLMESTGLYDKNGKEKYHQDIKRVLRFEPVFSLLGEPQNGETQVDTKIHVNNIVIDFAEEIAEDFLDNKIGQKYNASDVFNFFGLREIISQDEIQECILEPIASYGIKCNTVEEIAEYMNKDEVIGDIHNNPELLEKND